ncbi:MAG: hypothetical protein KDF65_04120, partial [Anaerolineae bacterium]|nr:hypothetical protein [Anaerolineae bacterium]
FVDFLSESEYQVTFLVDKIASPLPTRVDFIFDQLERPLLSIVVSGVTLNCHFFTIEEIELDLDPREVDDESKLRELLYFISRLGGVLEKEIKITPENVPDVPLFIFTPERGIVEFIAYS